jgi:hypothetical protein
MNYERETTHSYDHAQSSVELVLSDRALLELSAYPKESALEILNSSGGYRSMVPYIYLMTVSVSTMGCAEHCLEIVSMI